MIDSPYQKEDPAKRERDREADKKPKEETANKSIYLTTRQFSTIRKKKKSGLLLKLKMLKERKKKRKRNKLF